MSPAKPTPALSLKGFHRDVSNVLQQQSALGGVKARPQTESVAPPQCEG